MSPKTYGYLLAVGASGVWLLANELYALEASFREFGWTVFILALATFLAEIFELEIVPRWSITTGIAIIISAIYIGGAPLAIMVLLLASLPAEIILRWDRIKDFGPD